MKLDEIFDNWATDSIIKNTDLDNQSLNIPYLHSKYIKMLAIEKMTLQKLENDYKNLYKLKHEYFSGSLDLDTIKDNGWEQNPKLILKTDIGMHIDADKDIQNLTLKIGLQKEKVSTIDSILKNIANRGYYISNAINWQKMQNGM